jgi:ligand-binding SRPBCC domain-containing protein
MTNTTSQATSKTFTAKSVMNTTLKKMIDFHLNSGPRQLTPPPIFVQMHRDTRTHESLAQGELDFTLWFGPIPTRWSVRHETGPISTSFADFMVEGPLAYWRHEHIFTEVPNGVELTDRITLAHKAGWRGILSRLAFDGVPLRILFIYRHLITRLALRRQA